MIRFCRLLLANIWTISVNHLCSNLVHHDVNLLNSLLANSSKAHKSGLINLILCTTKTGHLSVEKLRDLHNMYYYHDYKEQRKEEEKARKEAGRQIIIHHLYFPADSAD